MWDVLIVEDNDEYRQSLQRLLSDRFPAMRISQAADGEQALHLALSRPFDLVFMDIRLPHANGLDLTRAIKAVHAATWICVISSHFILEYQEAAFRSGADHFIVKGESTQAGIVGLVNGWLQAHASGHDGARARQPGQ